MESVVFIGGKGGVGKSTMASAIALKHARNGAKTLLISTDPAHNLNDIFQTKPSDDIVQIDSNLFMLEINPQREVAAYIDEVSKQTKPFITAKSYALLDSYYENVKRNGNALESALFDRLIKLIVRDCKALEFQYIIVDTAPTGHTLRLFELPKIMQEWSKMLLNHQEKSKMLEGVIGHIEGKSPLQERLEERHLLYNEFCNILQNKQKCAIFFVLNPELLPIEETKRAMADLAKGGLGLKGVIVNKIPPQSDDEFFRKRYEISSSYMEIIEREFSGIECYKIPLQSSDIVGLQGLETLTRYL